MKILPLIAVLILASASTIASQAPDPKAPKAPSESSTQAAATPARVYFKNLRNGQVVPKKFKVVFGVEGIALKPAGDLTPGTGHHHLIVDGDAIPAGQVVPADATHLHFGKAQTETEIELAPGKHKLLLQYANGAHVSYGPELSSVIDVIVK